MIPLQCKKQHLDINIAYLLCRLYMCIMNYRHRLQIIQTLYERRCAISDLLVKFCHFYFFEVLNSVAFYLYYDIIIMLISHF